MRVAVFRTASDGARTAKALHALGHVAVLAPAMTIVRTDAAIPPGSAEAVIATSAHAFDAIAADPRLTWLRDRPCWCVGPRTAASARAQGVAQVLAGGGDADALVAAIQAAVRPGARLLFLAGQDRKPTVEIALTGAGYSLETVEVYRADPVTRWSEETARDLATCEAALHYSARSARIAVRLLGASNLARRSEAWRHYCLSADVADALRSLGLQAVSAARPDEDSLLALLSATSG